MRRGPKDLILLFVIILTVLSIAFAANTITKSNKFKRAFEKEMAFRLDMEERVSKLRNEKLDLTNKLKDRDLEIKELNMKIELLEKDIADQESKVKQLQVELNTMTLLKEKLEDNLKEELAKQKQ